jgi:Domain of unknown function (DUF4845)
VKEIKFIFGVALLLVGSFVLYKILPAYWNNYKVNRMIAEQAIIYTNFPKSEEEIKIAIAQKAQDLDVPIAPEQIAVSRSRGDVSISFAYSVHIDLPVYPFDVDFEDSTTNQNVMR